MSADSISLGDAIRKLTLHVHTDLQNTLLLMRGQDPELRTTELRQFIARSRRKLLQLYALAKWLSSAGITQCFRAIADFNGQLTTLDQETARNLDEMYFIHASIFTMRSRPYEVPLAVDIAAKQTYPSLPASMFSCGKPDFPAPMDLETVRRDLNVFLRAKISALNNLQEKNSMVITIAGGVLKLEVPHYFALFLTLSKLSEDASWVVLNCRLLTKPVSHMDTTEHKRADKTRESAEQTLLQALRKIACAEDSDGAGGNNGSSGGLRSMLQACRSAALDSCVHVLAQELEASTQIASNFAGVYSAALRTDITRKDIALLVKVWPSAFHREPQFELRVWKATADGAAGLRTALYTRLTYRSPTLVFASDSRQFPIPGVPEVIRGEGYVSRGCDAPRLVRDTLALLAQCKLRVLLTRLAGTMERLPAYLTSAVSVALKGTAIDVYHLSADACISVSVDARSGKYLVDAADLREVNGSGKKALDLFIAEINNLDAENYCSDYLLKNGLQSPEGGSSEATHAFAKIALLPLPLTTLDDVLGLFELHIIAGAVSAAVSDAIGLPALAPVLLPACGLGNAGLVYNLRFWEDTAEASRTLQSRSAYQAVFPYSHSSVDKAALMSTASSTALPVRRNTAKKRGFSEAALESSIPGGFVSAGQLAAEESAVEPARYASLQSEKAIFAAYFMVTPPNAEGSIIAAACLCRIVMKVVGSAVDAGVPVVLHHRVLRQMALRTADGTYSTPDFAVDIRDAQQWAEGFISKPAPLSDVGFSSASPAVTDFLVHGEHSLMVCRSSTGGQSATEAVDVTHFHSVQELARLQTAWKTQPNSLRGHMTGPCNPKELLELAQPLFYHSISFRRREDGGLDIVTSGSSWTATDRTAGNAHCTGVFAVHMVETLLGQWSIPAASAANAKAELYKRLNFSHVLLSLLRACMNFEGRETQGETDTAAAAPAARTTIRPVHFTVTPATSAPNSCKCTVSVVFAVETSRPAGATDETRSAAPTRASGRYLSVDADYMCSTIRGMGKSISTDEVCAVTLRDLVPLRFSECRTALELLAEDGAALKEILCDFLTK